MNLKDAFQFPFSDKFWARRLLIGGILLPIPGIFFFAFGYLMRHFESYLRGHKVDKLPEWDDLPRILTYGFFAFVIFLGYMLIPFVLFALAIVWIKYKIAYLLIGASFVIAVWFMSYFPMGLAYYLMTGKVKSAFQKNLMYDSISQISTTYYNSFILTILLLFVGGNSPWVIFYLLVVLSSVFGNTIRPVFTEDENSEEAA